MVHESWIQRQCLHSLFPIENSRTFLAQFDLVNTLEPIWKSDLHSPPDSTTSDTASYAIWDWTCFCDHFLNICGSVLSKRWGHYCLWTFGVPVGALGRTVESQPSMPASSAQPAGHCLRIWVWVRNGYKLCIRYRGGKCEVWFSSILYVTNRWWTLDRDFENFWLCYINLTLKFCLKHVASSNWPPTSGNLAHMCMVFIHR